MNLNKLLNLETITYSILATVTIIVLALGTKFTEITPAADKYTLILLFIWIAILASFIDKSLAKGRLPLKRLEPFKKNPTTTIFAGLIFSGIILTLFATHTLSFIQLFAINQQAIPQGDILAGLIALFYVAFVIGLTEEELRGGTVKSTIQHILDQLGIPYSDEIGKISNGLLFGLLHIVITQISFELAFAAFLLSILLDTGNQYFGYTFGTISHVSINSYVVGVVILQWGIFSPWFLPVVLVIAPYLLFTNRIKAL
jgi:hypothetical protein